ncbi:MAG: RimK/LysX family protein [Alphaproteobacteria bacterium]|nr:RimK/LysX family protein [Alphaproteobacteria bacterium]
MTKRPIRTGRRRLAEIGWREMVGLPDLGIPALRAKIDTGARTSALHAVDLQIEEEEGERWVEFHVPLPHVSRSKRCAAPIVDERQIKNTSGVTEWRYIIETTLVLGPRHWHVEMSLADREKMEFDLILGRTAIRGRRLLVNPSKSYLAGSNLELPRNVVLGREEGVSRTLARGSISALSAYDQGEEE